MMSKAASTLPTRSTQPKSPIPFPTEIAKFGHEDTLGCFRCLVWCAVIEASLCVAGVIAWNLWFS
jgi:hypothetical protein